MDLMSAKVILDDDIQCQIDALGMFTDEKKDSKVAFILQIIESYPIVSYFNRNPDKLAAVIKIYKNICQKASETSVVELED